MASAFRIFIHRNESNLHVKLMGDFDEAAAHQLLNILRKYRNGTSTIFIHTACLERIFSSGQNVFCCNLRSLKFEPVRLVFTGENATQLSP